MARKSNNTRIYGLTLKQWTMAAVIAVGLIIFGRQFIYNLITNKNPPSQNSGRAEKTNNKRAEKRQPGSGPNGNLSVEEATARYLKFGNPSNAAASDANNFLMVNPQYALSYNRSKATANWAAWTLTEGDLGTVDRANDFRPDPTLPKGFYHVTPNDYTGSGYDRGHLCPSADRTANVEANSTTFLMTNIVPQTPDLNRDVWESLESYSRELVRQGNELYITAGVRGQSAKLKGKITIPAYFWKIVLVAPNGVDDLANINSENRVIAVEIPNIDGIKNENWRKYRTTVRDIEQKTGLNLFSNLPQNVQNALENKQDRE